MTNHPNRSKGAPAELKRPTPKQVLEARDAAGLTQTKAANLIGVTITAWQRWEAGERQMQGGLFDLFRQKVAEYAVVETFAELKGATADPKIDQNQLLILLDAFLVAYKRWTDRQPFDEAFFAFAMGADVDRQRWIERLIPELSARIPAKVWIEYVRRY